MIFGSLCSGIEAASVASKAFGWKPAFFSEIEKFPNRVLEYHYPETPNLGDMTKFKEWPDVNIELLCGGTPCQSFSIAGLRKGLDDSRGNLMLTFGEMAARFRPDWIFWENVPGVLSSGGGRDFASFLGLISGRKISVPSGGWGKAGIIPGYKNAYGLAYRIFDAQYFGVAQRRRRVFVVGYIGDWRPAAAVLLERESLQGHPAPSRKKGEGITGTLEASLGRSRGAGTPAAGITPSKSHWDGGPHPSLTQSAQSSGGIGQSNQELFSQGGAGLVPHHVEIQETVGALCADTHPGAYSGQDAYTGRLVPHLVGTITGKMDADRGEDNGHLIAHTLRGEGFDASEDGTGRQNLAPICWDEEMNAREDISGALIRGGDGGRHAGVAVPAYGMKTAQTGSNGWGITEEVTNTLDTSMGIAIAQPISEQVVDTRVSNGDAHSGFRDEKGLVCCAFQQNQMGELRMGAVSGTLNTNSNASGRNTPMAKVGMAVRRLTPVECERLQGFPDGYTNVPDAKGKPAADGPRYKALGNSWAVPNVAWIFKRINIVNRLLKERHSDLI